MALHVDFKKETRMGYYTAPAMNGKRTKVWLCQANCTWAEINFYTKQDEDGKRIQMTQLCGFIVDIDHLKRCLKGVHSNYHGLTFFAKQMNAELWKAVKVLTENGIKVTIK